jgi:DNA-binding IclR family transcriptional regulator
MREYPAEWHAILDVIKDAPRTIPDIAAASGLDPALVTRHIMTMIRYRVAEPAGIDDSDQYHLYQPKR